MLRIGFDCEPISMVLLSSNGSGFEKGEGFFSYVQRLHSTGWRIEIAAWKESCKNAMREWAEQNGAFIPLDDFYSQITFLEGLRPAKPLDRTKRPR